MLHWLPLQGKPLYWNEYGLGGGSNQNGAVKATSAAVAAADPFFGVFGSYSPANDPWVLYNLSQASPVRNYMRYFYNQSFAYAAQTGVSSHPRAPQLALGDNLDAKMASV